MAFKASPLSLFGRGPLLPYHVVCDIAFLKAPFEPLFVLGFDFFSKPGIRKEAQGNRRRDLRGLNQPPVAFRAYRDGCILMRMTGDFRNSSDGH